MFHYEIVICSQVFGLFSILDNALEFAKDKALDSFPSHVAIWANGKFLVAVFYGEHIIFSDIQNQWAREKTKLNLPDDYSLRR